MSLSDVPDVPAIFYGKSLSLWKMMCQDTAHDLFLHLELSSIRCSAVLYREGRKPEWLQCRASGCISGVPSGMASADRNRWAGRQYNVFSAFVLEFLRLVRCLFGCFLDGSRVVCGWYREYVSFLSSVEWISLYGQRRKSLRFCRCSEWQRMLS